MTAEPTTAKRVAVVAPAPAAGTVGGAERAWTGLVEAIGRLTPHTAELVTVTVEEHNLVDLVHSYRRFAELDVSGFDVVITSKYPAWLIEHPHHVVHLFHTLRGLYDTYARTGLPPTVEPVPEHGPLRTLLDLVRAEPHRERLPDIWAAFDAVVHGHGAADPLLAFPGPLARELVHHLDGVALHPSSVRRYYALSATVAGRAGYFPPTITPEVVHLPSSLPGLGPTPSGPEAGFFTASRLDGPKRIHLVVQAMAHVAHDVALTIAGEGPERDRLSRLAAGDRRIRLSGGIDDAELARSYRTALAVPFVPADEDYGLITLEAMACATPVITTTDSGGPTELVVNGVNGLLAEPSAPALGRAMTRLVEHRSWAGRLGLAAARRAGAVTWEAAVAALLDERRPSTSPVVRLTAPGRVSTSSVTSPLLPAGRRLRVVTPSTYGIWPPRGGGQLRYVHLYGALARSADVSVVSLVSPPRAPCTHAIGPGLTETIVGVSNEQWQVDIDLTRAAGIPVTDIVAGLSIAATPQYMDALGLALDGADAVLLSHPFLLPAFEALGCDLPLVYDAHNAEADMKQQSLGTTAAGRELAAWVTEVEGRAVRRAANVVTCSVEDAASLGRRFGRSEDTFVVIPNGTNTRRSVPSVTDRLERSRAWRVAWSHTRNPHLDGRPEPEGLAVFFASWHPPNLDAAEVIIHLAATVPEVVFVLAGSHSQHFQGWTLPPNVVLAGVVSDATKDVLLSTADVALNPMRTGSGTNLKIVEYFAAGVPAVSTPFGVRGLEVDDRHLVLAEIPELAAATRSVLADRYRAAARAEVARHLAIERYDWQALGDRLAEVVADAVVLAGRGEGLAPQGAFARRNDRRNDRGCSA